MTEQDFVKQVYPDAEHITFCAECDNCKAPTLYFFTLPQYFSIDEKGMVHGGFYCWACHFGNAGSYPAELVVGINL